MCCRSSGGHNHDRDRRRDHRSDRDRGGSSRSRGGDSADYYGRGYRDRRRSPPPPPPLAGRYSGASHRGDPRERNRTDGYQRQANFELTPEERDTRTVFVSQLAARIRPRDLEDFFSSVGQIADVRLIMDSRTRRSKGVAYVEFREAESVALALGLTGTRLLGVPIQVQASQAEKNRVAQPASVLASLGPAGKSGPLKLYVGSLHCNITEEMLKGIFEPFGKIDDLKIMKDPSTGKSLGYGFVTYRVAEDAKKALEQLNGFELANRPMKVNSLFFLCWCWYASF